MPFRLLSLVTVLFLTTFPAAAAIVWVTGGPGVTTVDFSKPPSADPAVVTDQITPLVILGRTDEMGIFNLATELSFERHFSPAGTEWAFADLEGNPAALDASDFASLNFTNWEDSLGSRFALLGNIVDRPGVLHLTDEDIYLDITFTAWGGPGEGGIFSYTRTSGPIPEPSSALLLLAGGVLLCSRRRRVEESVKSDR